jgi:hypothetical protein
MEKTMNTHQLKQLAAGIRAWLGSNSITINHSQSLDYSAALVGLRNWPEVLSFPERVRSARLDLAAVERLATRFQTKHRHRAVPGALLAALEEALAPVTVERSENAAPLTIERLAEAWRRTVIDQEVSPIPGHSDLLEVLAAALGYDSYDGYRSASWESIDLREARFWVVDSVTAGPQIARLGLGARAPAVFDCLWQVVNDLKGPECCRSAADLHDKLQPFVEDAALHDDDVGSKMVTTNCVGPWDTSLDIEPADENLPEPGEVLVASFAGTVTGEDDDDRPFCGDTVVVEGFVSMTMVGRRLCSAPRMEILNAELDWSWAERGDDDHDNLPSYSRGEAIALELNLPRDYAMYVEDAVLHPVTTNDEIIVSYVVDLSTCPPSEVIEELARNNGGSLQTRVLGTSFEYIRHDPWA